MKILYEDENYLVIDKPSGVMVHSDGKTKEKTLSDFITENYPELENVGEPIVLNNGEVIKKPGIVHRLDKETSGVIAIAKNQKAYLFLKSQFKERKIKKIYKAFVYGRVKEEKGVIDRAISRSKKFGLWSAQRGGRGKEREAITEYKVLEKCDEASYLELRPKTGRTHQLRVHLKAINHPILSDKLYAPQKESLLGFERLALHAEEITFESFEGNKITIKAPLPKDFIKALELLKSSC